MSVGKKRRWIAVSAAAIAAALGASERAQAGSFYWEGDNGTVWKTNTGLFGSNWSSQLTVNNDPLLLPGANDDVFFSGLGAPSGPISTTLGQDFSIRSLTYLASNTDTVSIDGSIVNSLTIGSGGISIFGGALGGNQITANVVVGANQTWANNVPNTVFFLGGVVSGSNALATAGPGTFVFTGANTLSGSLTASTAGNAITFALANGSALNLSSLALNNNAVLNLDSTSGNHATQNRLADNLTVNSSGGIINLLGNAATATTETVGTLQLNTGATQVNVTGAAGSTMTFGSAVIPSIARTVGGTVNFNPAAGTFINLPNVAVTNGIIGGHATVGSIAGAFGSQVDWATLDGSKNVVPFNSANYVTTLSTPTAADNVQLSSQTPLNVGSNTTINSLYLTQTGSITFQNGSNSTETLIIGSGGIISNGATPTANVNGNTAQQNTVIIGNQAGDVNGFTHGFITSGTGELIITAANGSGVRIASVIKDNGATPVNLTINGNGLVDLGNGNAQANKTVNTYTGITTVNGATLVVNAELQFGAVPATFRANEITLNGGTVLTTAGFGFAATRGITVGAAGGTLRYTGGSTWTLAAAITGPGGVTFSALPTSTAGGGDTVVVNQASGNNTYQGPTTFEVGKNPFTANVGSVQLGQNNELPNNTALTVTQAGGQGTAFGNINFNGKTLTVGSLAGNAPIINHNSLFTLGQNGLSTEYTGVISGTGSITKVGGGTQKFSGNNTYSGATTINGGTLLINGAPTGTGAFTVNSGGALGGNGTIAAPITVNSGGALAPAIDQLTPTTLNINNNLTLANGASLNYLFGAPGVSDMVNVNGATRTLTLTGGVGSDILNINDLPGFGVGTYTLLQAAGGATLVDTANFVVNGTTAFNYAVTATPGTNGSVILTVTPGNPTLAWSGAVNGNWDTTTGNWSGSADHKWTNTDNAVFDNSGLNTNITVVAAGVTPNSMVFNNGVVNYSFAGGTITDSGGFTKNQAGSVTFSDTVTVGVAKINAGLVTIAPGGSFTSPSLTVASGATLNVNGVLGASTVLQSDGVTTFSGTSQTLAGLNGGALGVVNLNGPTALTLGSGSFAGVINGLGSSIIVNSPSGAGAQALGGVNTYTGSTTVINGTLVAGGNVASGVAGPFGVSATPLLVGDVSGSGTASLLIGGPFTISRDISVRAGSTGSSGLGGSTPDVSTFANNISLGNTNAATLLTAAAGGTVNYSGAITGAGSVNVGGLGTTVFNGTTAQYTGSTLVSSGTLSVPGVLNSTSLSVGSAAGGTLTIPAGGSVSSTNAITINPGGTINVFGTVATPVFNVGAPGSANAQLTFGSGVSYSNTANILGPGFVTISATDTANANLITGPINLSNSGGVILMVQQQATGALPVNTYNGRINLSGATGTNGADGILQVRDSGVSTVVGIGIFTNVHLTDNSHLNFGLAPGAATPRDLIVADLTLDGPTAFLSSNADGSSPEFVRNITATSTNAGTLLTVFGSPSPNIANSNAPLNAKSINFVGSLSPNLTVLNSESPASGINLTSNTNITNLAGDGPASFLLNGGTFQTGSFMGGNGTTNLTAAAASPGTNGTFLVTDQGTFNVSRSADATVTYYSGTLNFNVDQTLVALNIGDGTNAASLNVPQALPANITTGKLNVANASTLSASSGIIFAGPTRIDGTLNLFGGSVLAGTITGVGQINMNVDPGLVTGDANSGTFDGSINGTSSLTKIGTGVWTVSGTNNTYTGATIINAGTLKVTGSIATSSGVTVNDGFFEAGASQTVSVLTLATTGNAKITASAHPGATPNVLTLNNLIINSATSSVDMTNNAMILENTTPTDVRGLLITGRHSGAWNGPGINSSTAAASPNTRAVGYASAATLLPGGTTWLGQPIDSTSVLVRSTINGDANLDGAVGFADLVAVAQHYGTLGSGTWITGDFNYDGNVDFADLVAVAQNYNGALPAGAIPSASAAFSGDMAAAFSSVPEPGSLGFMALAGLAGLRRRRRR